MLHNCYTIVVQNFYNKYIFFIFYLYIKNTKMDKIITINCTEKEHKLIKTYAKKDINSIRSYTKKVILEHCKKLALEDEKREIMIEEGDFNHDLLERTIGTDDKNK